MISHIERFKLAGIVFSDYDEQLKLQRNTSMVVLRSLGYGKKSIESKIIEEADHLVEAFMVNLCFTMQCKKWYEIGQHR